MNAEHTANHQTRIGRQLGRFICGLGGHELLRVFEPGRLYLRCTSCTYETPGWTLKERREPSEGQPMRRHALIANGAR